MSPFTFDRAGISMRCGNDFRWPQQRQYCALAMCGCNGRHHARQTWRILASHIFTCREFELQNQVRQDTDAELNGFIRDLYYRQTHNCGCNVSRLSIAANVIRSESVFREIARVSLADDQAAAMKTNAVL